MISQLQQQGGVKQRTAKAHPTHPCQEKNQQGRESRAWFHPAAIHAQSPPRTCKPAMSLMTISDGKGCPEARGAKVILLVQGNDMQEVI